MSEPSALRDLDYILSLTQNPEEAPVQRLRDYVAGRESIESAADELSGAVAEHVEGRGYVPLETLLSPAHRLTELLTDSASSMHPVTAIEEKIAHAGWVLNQLVGVTGFQAELVVYGGDFEERGTNVNRDCRITVRREEFGAEHLKALVEFAARHGCQLTVGKHGATLRVREGRRLEITRKEGLAVNALTTGAAAGSGNSGIQPGADLDVR